nr:hypothetical protein [Tanacetum cinerariifolium]
MKMEGGDESPGTDIYQKGKKRSKTRHGNEKSAKNQKPKTYGYLSKGQKTKQNRQNQAREWKERKKPKAEDETLTPLTPTLIHAGDPCEGGFDPRDEINGLEAKSRSRADNEG